MADLMAARGAASARCFARRSALYEAQEDGFADRASRGEKDIRSILRNMFALLSRSTLSIGKATIIVSVATNCAPESAALGAWLPKHRKAKAQSIIERLRQAKHAGEVAAMSMRSRSKDCCVALLHGLSVQARDGVDADRLDVMVEAFLEAFDLMTTWSPRIGDRASNRKSSHQ